MSKTNARRRLIVRRRIHGFQVGDILMVCREADGTEQVDLVRLHAWDPSAVHLAELNGFLEEDPPEDATHAVSRS